MIIPALAEIRVLMSSSFFYPCCLRAAPAVYCLINFRLNLVASVFTRCSIYKPLLSWLISIKVLLSSKALTRLPVISVITIRVISLALSPLNVMVLFAGLGNTRSCVFALPQYLIPFHLSPRFQILDQRCWQQNKPCCRDW